METHAISPNIFQTRVSLRRTHFLTCGISAATLVSLVCNVCTQRKYKGCGGEAHLINLPHWKLRPSTTTYNNTHTSKCYAVPRKMAHGPAGWLSMGWWMASYLGWSENSVALNPLDNDWLVVSTYPSEKYEFVNLVGWHPIYHGKYKSHVWNQPDDHFNHFPYIFPMENTKTLHILSMSKATTVLWAAVDRSAALCCAWKQQQGRFGCWGIFVSWGFSWDDDSQNKPPTIYIYNNNIQICILHIVHI